MNNKILNKIVLGTANFQKNYGYRTKSIIKTKKIKKIIILLRKKINHLDTAINYTGVDNQLGKLNLKNFKISTKIPKIHSRLSKDKIENKIFHNLLNSKKKLGIRKFDIVYFHQPTDLLNNNGKYIYNALIKLKEEKIISKIGISVYSKEIIFKIVNKFKIDIVQMPINILDRRFLNKKLIIILKKKKIKIYARSIFLQGVLLKDKKALPRYFFRWNKLFNNWYDWNRANNQKLLDTALKFVLDLKIVDKIIIGISSEKQLMSILKSLKKLKNIKFPKNIFSNDLKLIDPRLW